MRILSRHATAVLAVFAVATLTMTSAAVASNYHHGDHLSCAACHIMHATYTGAGATTTINGGNGVANLLKGTVNETCLSCHNSSSRDCVASGTAAAPNDTLSNAYPSPYKNSAGFFQSDCLTVSTPLGHDLLPGDVQAIQGTWSTGADGMQCSDCHEPHGNENFRNLKEEPGTAAAPVAMVPGTEVYLRDTPTGWANQKDTGAVAFASADAVVNWCIGCHTNITTGNKHPQGAALTGSEADGAHWTGGTGAGFGTAVGDGTAGIPRLRFAQAGADFAASTTAADTNQVFCLSCHKAHGSKNDSALLWPHYTDGAADQASGCAQCHNKGT